MIKKSIINRDGKLIIYTGPKGTVELRADTDKETIWATQAQITDLFNIDRTVVTRHISNILKDKEIDKKSNVQKMHIPNSDRPISLYSLDVILAVGYRTNSSKAIKFRQWATKILRKYLIEGIVVNNEKIKKLPDRILADLDEKISFIQRTIKKRELNQNETDSLLSVIHDYANSWRFLKEYDEGELKLRRGKDKEKRHFEYDFIRSAIDKLKDEKAAHLLYFIIKDHPFSDGNKRIGSFIFIYFLKLNGILSRINGENKINDNTLVALALLIAESDPKDKELMVALTTNLLA